jgi:hypothetical protein
MKILTLAVIMSILACSKKHEENTKNPLLPQKLTISYNDSTYCHPEGCKAYIQLITYESKKYFSLGYDTGPLCDLTGDPLPIYDENGNEIEINSELYKNVSTKGKRGDRIWQCKILTM